MCEPLTTVQMISLGLSAAGTAISAMGAYQQSKVAGEVAARNAQIALRMRLPRCDGRQPPPRARSAWRWPPRAWT